VYKEIDSFGPEGPTTSRKGSGGEEGEGIAHVSGYWARSPECLTHWTVRVWNIHKMGSLSVSAQS